MEHGRDGCDGCLPASWLSVFPDGLTTPRLWPLGDVVKAAEGPFTTNKEKAGLSLDKNQTRIWMPSLEAFAFRLIVQPGRESTGHKK